MNSNGQKITSFFENLQIIYKLNYLFNMAPIQYYIDAYLLSLQLISRMDIEADIFANDPQYIQEEYHQTDISSEDKLIVNLNIRAEDSIELLQMTLSDPEFLNRYSSQVRKAYLDGLFAILHAQSDFDRKISIAQLVGSSVEEKFILEKEQANKQFKDQILKLIEANDNESMLVGLNVIKATIEANKNDYLRIGQLLMTEMRHHNNDHKISSLKCLIALNQKQILRYRTQYEIVAHAAVQQLLISGDWRGLTILSQLEDVLYLQDQNQGFKKIVDNVFVIQPKSLTQGTICQDLANILKKIPCIHGQSQTCLETIIHKILLRMTQIYIQFIDEQINNKDSALQKSPDEILIDNHILADVLKDNVSEILPILMNQRKTGDTFMQQSYLQYQQENIQKPKIQQWISSKPYRNYYPISIQELGPRPVKLFSPYLYRYSSVSKDKQKMPYWNMYQICFKTSFQFVHQWKRLLQDIRKYVIKEQYLNEFQMNSSRRSKQKSLSKIALSQYQIQKEQKKNLDKIYLQMRVSNLIYTIYKARKDIQFYALTSFLSEFKQNNKENEACLSKIFAIKYIGIIVQNHPIDLLEQQWKQFRQILAKQTRKGYLALKQAACRGYCRIFQHTPKKLMNKDIFWNFTAQLKNQIRQLEPQKQQKAYGYCLENIIAAYGRALNSNFGFLTTSQGLQRFAGRKNICQWISSLPFTYNLVQSETQMGILIQMFQTSQNMSFFNSQCYSQLLRAYMRFIQTDFFRNRSISVKIRCHLLALNMNSSLNDILNASWRGLDRRIKQRIIALTNAQI